MTKDKRLDIDCGLATDLLVRFIASETGKTGMKKAVLGLSGGIDSALAAFLCAKALGGGNVMGVRMPYRSSSSDSLEHAEQVAKAAGIEMCTFDISQTCDSFLASKIGPGTAAAGFFPDGPGPMSGLCTGNSRGNVMARCRMITLYHLSAATDSMVVGTSNKTELLLGYGTLWGDLAFGINPVGDLYKHQVRQLSAHLGVPQAVIDKKPSADLFPGQTDEGDLGFSYAELDRALFRLVDCRENPKDLAASGEFPPELVAFCMKKITSMQFKRQMPLIAMISFRTINQSFNYPRDWSM